MSLPAGVYTQHSFGGGTAAVMPDTGAQYGTWAKPRVLPAPASGAWQQYSMAPSGFGATLPAGVWTQHSFGGGTAAVMPDTGAQYGAWQRVERVEVFADTETVAWEVAGELNVVMTFPAPQGITVAGELSVAFQRVSGTVQLSGAFAVPGEIATVFRASVPGAFAVDGELKVSFFSRGGQELSCITGPGVPEPAPDAGGAPRNAVY